MSDLPFQTRNRDDSTQDADPRSAMFAAGVSPDGQRIPLSPGALRRRVEGFPVTSTTPEGVASLLETSRALIVQGYFKYEIFAVGASWSLMAVEAGLRQRLASSRLSFHRLISFAEERRIVTNVQAEFLQVGRQVRNAFAHATQQYVYSPTMALEIVATSHSLVAEMFPDDAASSAPEFVPKLGVTVARVEPSTDADAVPRTTNQDGDRGQ